MKHIKYIFLVLFISLTAYGQQKINLVVNSYYIVQETATGDTIRSTASEREAIEHYINYVNETGSKTAKIYYPNEMRIDITGEAQAPPQLFTDVVIDTFTTVADFILLDFTNSLVMPSNDYILVDKDNKYADTIRNPKKYALIMGQGLHEIEADTIHRWQKFFKLERTRSFGEVKFKSLDVPFQFRDSLNLTPGQTDYRIQTFASKQHCVSYYLDNKEYKINASCNPGQLSSIEWRHTFTFIGLEPNTKYLVRVQGVSMLGEIDFKEFYINTEP